ncbi:hypothetical protein DIPPA_25127, partial [Diplonema papillatum]
AKLERIRSLLADDPRDPELKGLIHALHKANLFTRVRAAREQRLYPIEERVSKLKSALSDPTTDLDSTRMFAYFEKDRSGELQLKFDKEPQAGGSPTSSEAESVVSPKMASRRRNYFAGGSQRAGSAGTDTLGEAEVPVLQLRSSASVKDATFRGDPAPAFHAMSLTLQDREQTIVILEDELQCVLEERDAAIAACDSLLDKIRRYEIGFTALEKEGLDPRNAPAPRRKSLANDVSAATETLTALQAERDRLSEESAVLDTEIMQQRADIQAFLRHNAEETGDRPEHSDGPERPGEGPPDAGAQGNDDGVLQAGPAAGGEHPERAMRSAAGDALRVHEQTLLSLEVRRQRVAQEVAGIDREVVNRVRDLKALHSEQTQLETELSAAAAETPGSLIGQIRKQERAHANLRAEYRRRTEEGERIDSEIQRNANEIAALEAEQPAGGEPDAPNPVEERIAERRATLRELGVRYKSVLVKRDGLGHALCHNESELIGLRQRCIAGGEWQDVAATEQTDPPAPPGSAELSASWAGVNQREKEALAAFSFPGGAPVDDLELTVHDWTATLRSVPHDQEPAAPPAPEEEYQQVSSETVAEWRATVSRLKGEVERARRECDATMARGCCADDAPPADYESLAEAEAECRTRLRALRAELRQTVAERDAAVAENERLREGGAQTGSSPAKDDAQEEEAEVAEVLRRVCAERDASSAASRDLAQLLRRRNDRIKALEASIRQAGGSHATVLQRNEAELAPTSELRESFQTDVAMRFETAELSLQHTASTVGSVPARELRESFQTDAAMRIDIAELSRQLDKCRASDEAARAELRRLTAERDAAVASRDDTTREHSKPQAESSGDSEELSDSMAGQGPAAVNADPRTGAASDEGPTPAEAEGTRWERKERKADELKTLRTEPAAADAGFEAQPGAEASRAAAERDAARAELDDMREELKRKEKTVNALRLDAAEARDKLGEREAAFSALKAEAKRAAADRDEARSANDDVVEELKRKEATLRALRQGTAAMEDLQDKLSEQESACSALKAELKRVAADRDEARSANDDLLDELKRKDAALKALRQDVAAMEDLQDKLSEQDSAYSAAKAEMKRLTADRDEARSTNDDLLEELKRKDSTLKALRQDTAAMEDLQDKLGEQESAYAALKAETKRITADRDEARSANDDLLDELKRKDTTLKALRQDVAAMEGMQDKLSEQDSVHSAAKAEMKRVTAERDQALAANDDLLEELKRKDTTLKALRQEVAAMEHTQDKLSEQESAYSALKAEMKRVAAERDQALAANDDLLQELKRKDTTLKTLRQDTAAMEDTQDKLSEQESAYSALKAEMKRIASERDAAQSAADDLSEELRRKERERARDSAALAETRAAAAERDGAFFALKADLKRAAVERDAAASLNDELRAEIHRKAGEAKALTRESSALAEVRETVSERDREVFALKTDLKRAAAERDAAASSADDLRAEVNRKNAEIKALTRETAVLEELRETVSERDREVFALKTDLKRAVAERDSAASSSDDLRAEVHRKNTEIKALARETATLDELRETMSEQDRSVFTLKTDLKRAVAERDAATSSNDALTAEVHRKNTEIKALTRETATLEELRETVSERDREAFTLKTDLKRAVAERDAAISSNDELNAEVHRKNTEIKALTRETATLEELRETVSEQDREVSTLRTDLKRAATERDAAASSAADLRAEVHRKNGEIAALAARGTEAGTVSLQAALARAEEANRVAQADLQKLVASETAAAAEKSDLSHSLLARLQSADAGSAHDKPGCAEGTHRAVKSHPRGPSERGDDLKTDPHELESELAGSASRSSRSASPRAAYPQQPGFKNLLATEADASRREMSVGSTLYDASAGGWQGPDLVGLLAELEKERVLRERAEADAAGQLDALRIARKAVVTLEESVARLTRRCADDEDSARDSAAEKRDLLERLRELLDGAAAEEAVRAEASRLVDDVHRLEQANASLRLRLREERESTSRAREDEMVAASSLRHDLRDLSSQLETERLVTERSSSLTTLLPTQSALASHLRTFRLHLTAPPSPPQPAQSPLKLLRHELENSGGAALVAPPQHTALHPGLRRELAALLATSDAPVQAGPRPGLDGDHDVLADQLAAIRLQLAAETTVDAASVLSPALLAEIQHFFRATAQRAPAEPLAARLSSFRRQLEAGPQFVPPTLQAELTELTSVWSRRAGVRQDQDDLAFQLKTLRKKIAEAGSGEPVAPRLRTELTKLTSAWVRQSTVVGDDTLASQLEQIKTEVLSADDPRPHLSRRMQTAVAELAPFCAADGEHPDAPPNQDTLAVQLKSFRHHLSSLHDSRRTSSAVIAPSLQTELTELTSAWTHRDGAAQNEDDLAFQLKTLRKKIAEAGSGEPVAPRLRTELTKLTSAWVRQSTVVGDDTLASQLEQIKTEVLSADDPRPLLSRRVQTAVAELAPFCAADGEHPDAPPNQDTLAVQLKSFRHHLSSLQDSRRTSSAAYQVAPSLQAELTELASLCETRGGAPDQESLARQLKDFREHTCAAPTEGGASILPGLRAELAEVASFWTQREPKAVGQHHLALQLQGFREQIARSADEEADPLALQTERFEAVAGDLGQIAPAMQAELAEVVSFWTERAGFAGKGTDQESLARQLKEFREHTTEGGASVHPGLRAELAEVASIWTQREPKAVDQQNNPERAGLAEKGTDQESLARQLKEFREHIAARSGGGARGIAESMRAELSVLASFWVSRELAGDANELAGQNLQDTVAGHLRCLRSTIEDGAREVNPSPRLRVEVQKLSSVYHQRDVDEAAVDQDVLATQLKRFRRQVRESAVGTDQILPLITPSMKAEIGEISALWDGLRAASPQRLDEALDEQPRLETAADPRSAVDAAEELFGQSSPRRRFDEEQEPVIPQLQAEVYRLRGLVEVEKTLADAVAAGELVDVGSLTLEHRLEHARESLSAFLADPYARAAAGDLDHLATECVPRLQAVLSDFAARADRHIPAGLHSSDERAEPSPFRAPPETSSSPSEEAGPRARHDADEFAVYEAEAERRVDELEAQCGDLLKTRRMDGIEKDALRRKLAESEEDVDQLQDRVAELLERLSRDAEASQLRIGALERQLARLRPSNPAGTPPSHPSTPNQLDTSPHAPGLSKLFLIEDDDPQPEAHRRRVVELEAEVAGLRAQLIRKEEEGVRTGSDPRDTQNVNDTPSTSRSTEFDQAWGSPSESAAQSGGRSPDKTPQPGAQPAQQSRGAAQRAGELGGAWPRGSESLEADAVEAALESEVRELAQAVDAAKASLPRATSASTPQGEHHGGDRIHEGTPEAGLEDSLESDTAARAAVSELERRLRNARVMLRARREQREGAETGSRGPRVHAGTAVSDRDGADSAGGWSDGRQQVRSDARDRVLRVRQQSPEPTVYASAHSKETTTAAALPQLKQQQQHHPHAPKPMPHPPLATPPPSDTPVGNPISTHSDISSASVPPSIDEDLPGLKHSPQQDSATSPPAKPAASPHPPHDAPAARLDDVLQENAVLRESLRNATSRVVESAASENTLPGAHGQLAASALRIQQLETELRGSLDEIEDLMEQLKEAEEALHREKKENLKLKERQGHRSAAEGGSAVGEGPSMSMSMSMSPQRLVSDEERASEVADLRTRLSELEEDLARALDERQQLDEEVGRLHDFLENSNALCDQKQEQVDDLRSQLLQAGGGSQPAAETAEEELSNLRESNTVLTEKLRLADEDAARLREDIEQTVEKQVAASLSESEAQIRALESKLADAEADSEEQRQAIDDYRAIAKEMTTRGDTAQARVSELTAEADQLREKADRLAAENADIREKTSLELEEMTMVRRGNDSAPAPSNERVVELELEVAALQELNAALAKKVTSFKSTNIHLALDKSQLAARLQDAEDKVFDLEGDLKSVTARLTAANEEADSNREEKAGAASRCKTLERELVLANASADLYATSTMHALGSSMAGRSLSLARVSSELSGAGPAAGSRRANAPAELADEYQHPLRNSPKLRLGISQLSGTGADAGEPHAFDQAYAALDEELRRRTEDLQAMTERYQEQLRANSALRHRVEVLEETREGEVIVRSRSEMLDRIAAIVDQQHASGGRASRRMSAVAPSSESVCDSKTEALEQIARMLGSRTKELEADATAIGKLNGERLRVKADFQRLERMLEGQGISASDRAALNSLKETFQLDTSRLDFKNCELQASIRKLQAAYVHILTIVRSPDAPDSEGPAGEHALRELQIENAALTCVLQLVSEQLQAKEAACKKLRDKYQRLAAGHVEAEGALSSNVNGGEVLTDVAEAFGKVQVLRKAIDECPVVVPEVYDAEDFCGALILKYSAGLADLRRESSDKARLRRTVSHMSQASFASKRSIDAFVPTAFPSSAPSERATPLPPLEPTGPSSSSVDSPHSSRGQRRMYLSGGPSPASIVGLTPKP